MFLHRRGKTNIYSVSGCSREEVSASRAAIYIPARRAATCRRLNSKSRIKWIGAMEIAGLDVQISMSGRPVLQMWHPFNSTHGGTWSRPVADTKGNITVHHGRCCSHMEQTRNHTEDNTCRFKMSLLVHGQCRRSMRTANSRSTHVMSLFMSSMAMLLRNGWNCKPCWYNIFTRNKTMNNHAKCGRYFAGYSDRSGQLTKSPVSK
jgi:hypothetical protein